MRISQSLQFFTLYLVTFTAAWPWPVDKLFPDVDSLIVRDAFFKRADVAPNSKASDTASSPSPKKTAANDASPSASNSDNKSKAGTVSKTAGGSDSSPSGTASGSAVSGSGSGSDTATGKTGKTTSTSKHKTTSATKTTAVSVPANAAAGGLELLVPDTTTGSAYYKISNFVTFAWNFTSLYVTPSHINVYASCSANSAMYTLTNNMSTNGNATGAVVWDTNNYPEETSAPLALSIYTLYIFDADSSISADAEPGHLTVFEYPFAMYTKTPYTKLPEWKCDTCSGALSADDRRYFGFMLGMGVITVMSFTWFVGGTGVIW